MSDNLRDLTLIIKSRFPLVQVETSEEVRMMQLLERAANLENWPLFVWSIADGIRRIPRTDVITQTYEFQAALRHACRPGLLSKGLQACPGRLRSSVPGSFHAIGIKSSPMCHRPALPRSPSEENHAPKSKRHPVSA